MTLSDILMMMSLMMTKRKRDGSIFMGMSSNFQRRSHCFQLLLDPAHSFLHSQHSSSSSHLLVCSIHTTGEPYSQH
ncbi:unnamed protein product [Musa acuminata subsp. malaccensis]|uniref:(wild Malaysian banana) hypothetical protein n=1 Tax=Musa acuminata subsp. malaccensis TaxID=214687 RepID=A0A804KMZ1_MUSAM|nr:unnamed protein product [Musa acuminata subsp. malaccensis]